MDSIDKQIADLERQLAALRRQKLSQLQSEMAALQAALSGEAEAPAPARRGRKPKAESKGWAASIGTSSAPSKGPKKRGRKRGKQVPDEEALASLTKAVVAAGADGISARNAAETSGVFYPRAIKLMDANFKKSGSGKWTRYRVK